MPRDHLLRGETRPTLGTMTDISFWNKAITYGPTLVDSQTAQLIRIRVEPGSREQIVVREQSIEARRFHMAGTKSRSGSVWSDDAGSLVKAVVTTRGETLHYELADTRGIGGLRQWG